MGSIKKIKLIVTDYKKEEHKVIRGSVLDLPQCDRCCKHTHSDTVNHINNMSSTPSSDYFRKIPYKQDLPPPGGYAKLEWKRNLPSRFIGGARLMAAGVGVMAYGWYWVIIGMRQTRELRREADIARLSLLPLLFAEEDRTLLKMVKRNQLQEAEIMKDVPGWTPGESVYNAGRDNDRWVKPRQEDLEPYY